MAKIPSFPLILIAPVVAAKLSKEKILNTGFNQVSKASAAQFKWSRLYFQLISLLMFAFIIVVSFGWINGVVLLSFVIGCLLLNSYCIFKTFTQSNPRKITTRAISLNWSNTLSGRVMQPIASSNAPTGYSEDFFSVYLKRYFDGIVFSGEAFPIPNSALQYSSDFSIVLSDGLSIIVEIDEPYYYKDGTPTHCINSSKDKDRNEFFLAGAWSIIRFAEEQIVINPEGCCLEIATLLFQLTNDQKYLAGFAPTVCSVEKIRCWNHLEAEVMAKGKYRDRYLLQSGIKQGFSR